MARGTLVSIHLPLLVSVIRFDRLPPALGIITKVNISRHHRIGSPESVPFPGLFAALAQGHSIVKPRCCLTANDFQFGRLVGNYTLTPLSYNYMPKTAVFHSICTSTSILKHLSRPVYRTCRAEAVAAAFRSFQDQTGTHCYDIGLHILRPLSREYGTRP
ncbi:hypothetical protein V8C34DRAFT_265956 [Trichoderma compactum]